ncbi:MAG: dTDP-glucose 4,6-dehydratase [Polyangiaceae bacterium]|jgi:dTDP-glucose 4,6-dehydratase
METVLVTGGAGFIGSNFIHHAVGRGFRVINLDKLTYAANPENLAALVETGAYELVRGDIANRALVSSILAAHRPSWIVNFAAESHVDRSIDSPDDFVRTNVLGTFELLQAALAYWKKLELARAREFRFLQVSTDEVFGSLGSTGLFSEGTAYAPNSPYAASKAAADHFVRAMHATFGLPTLTTNCSNNFGPYQFPEKLVPLMILNALEGKPLPVYGDGLNVRDWLYVEDHCRALLEVLTRADPGVTFTIGGRSERSNLDVVKCLCALLDQLVPPASNPHLASRASSLSSYAGLIQFVTDRPGHDRRYAVDPGAIERALGWGPTRSFEAAMRETVSWYLENRAWCERVSSGAYRRERLGLGDAG